MKVNQITGRMILDSRGNPTVEAEVVTDTGSMGRAAVPSGASIGKREALELRDGGKEFGGLGVNQAVNHITNIIAPAVRGLDCRAQSQIDQCMIDLDGTTHKSRLGANGILAVSLAVAKAAAAGSGLALYQYVAKLAGTNTLSLPMPLMNILNGGQHAPNSTDIQEFMVVPIGAKTFRQAVRMGTEVFHQLALVLKNHNYSTALGDEGGYAPSIVGGTEGAISLITQAIQLAGYSPGRDLALAIDVASSELVKGTTYTVDSVPRSSADMIKWYQHLSGLYPLISIEDGLSQDDWTGWQQLTKALGQKVQLVGDDLLVTNRQLLQKAIQAGAANAILIKPNQIGTLTETIAAVMMAKQAGYHTIVSHRSGETEDTTIAHLAVGLNAGQIKTGSLARSERTAKYNELMRIEDQTNLKLAPLTIRLLP